MDHVEANIKSVLCLLAVLCALLRVTKSQLTALNQCTCPGQSASFRCTVIGNGNTVYSVTGCSEELTLLGTGFNDGTSRDQCLNGAIRAYGVRAYMNNMTFVSQLNITPSQTHEDVTVECYREENHRLHLIDRKTLSVDPAPPTDVHVVSKDPLTFRWSEVPNHCGPTMSVQYEVNAIDCGSCPSRVSDTYAVCSGARTMDTCHFAVKTVICGNITGLSNSEPVYVNNSATTAETLSESTTTATLDEKWTTFRENVVGILITVLVLLVIVVIGVVIGVVGTVIGVVIIIAKAKKFFEDVNKLFRSGYDSPPLQNDVAAVNQDQGIVQEIYRNVQQLRTMQNNANYEIKQLLQLIIKQFPGDGNPKVNSYDQAKDMAKAHKDTAQYSRSLEDVNNVTTESNDEWRSNGIKITN